MEKVRFFVLDSTTTAPNIAPNLAGVDNKLEQPLKQLYSAQRLVLSILKAT